MKNRTKDNSWLPLLRTPCACAGWGAGSRLKNNYIGARTRSRVTGCAWRLLRPQTRTWCLAFVGPQVAHPRDTWQPDATCSLWALSSPGNFDTRMSLLQAPACTGGPTAGWMAALVSPLRPQAVQPHDPGKAPEPGHGDGGSRWGAWRSFLRRLRLCGGAPDKHRAQAGNAVPHAACSALPEKPAAGGAAQRPQGACALAGDPGRGLQGGPGAGSAGSAQLGGGACAYAPAGAGSGGGTAADGDLGLADSTAAAAAVVGRTSEWEAFLASHTHEWEFTARSPDENGERRGAAPRRRRHGGEHARPGMRQRDTSFYATMVPPISCWLLLCSFCFSGLA